MLAYLTKCHFSEGTIKPCYEGLVKQEEGNAMSQGFSLKFEHKFLSETNFTDSESQIG